MHAPPQLSIPGPSILVHPFVMWGTTDPQWPISSVSLASKHTLIICDWQPPTGRRGVIYLLVFSWDQVNDPSQQNNKRGEKAGEVAGWLKRLEPALHFLQRIRDEEAVWGELSRIAVRQQRGSWREVSEEVGLGRNISWWAPLICHPDPGLSALTHRVTER